MIKVPIFLSFKDTTTTTWIVTSDENSNNDDDDDDDDDDVGLGLGLGIRVRIRVAIRVFFSTPDKLLRFGSTEILQLSGSGRNAVDEIGSTRNVEIGLRVAIRVRVSAEVL